MEYNKLTKDLLSKGYTADHYPPYVRIGTVVDMKNPLNNYDGGFVYTRLYAESIVYKTGCGRFILGSNVIDDMGYGGVEWNHENDNPVFFCPFRNKNCPCNHPLLDELSIDRRPLCCCHRTDEAYDYENSIEKIEKDKETRKTAAREAFIEERCGKACIHQMKYDDVTEQWSMEYDPMKCAKNSCMGYCPLRGRELENKKGNVYVDKKYTTVRRDDTFFNGQEYISIRKGVRFFSSPKNIEICREVAQKCSEQIKSYYYCNEGSLLQMLSNPETLEILNIRADSKPSRDLLQDLADIKAGITITHDSDSEKRFAEQKKAHRKELQDKKRKSLAKRIVSLGFHNLSPHSTDYKHAVKWFTEDELIELDKQHQLKMKTESYEQVTLFDVTPATEVIIYESN